MNSPGQKFVDDFATEELSPLLPIFLKGAYIIYAHSVLQQQCALGYTSHWAEKNFGSVAEKNEFFEALGETLQPQNEEKLRVFTEQASPNKMLNKIKAES
jgi:hypothetical protein